MLATATEWTEAGFGHWNLAQWFWFGLILFLVITWAYGGLFWIWRFLDKFHDDYDALEEARKGGPIDERECDD